MIHPDCHCAKAEHHHGSIRTYDTHGCRCEECAEARRVYQRRAHRRRGFAKWNPELSALQPLDEVRAHIQKLVASGMTPTRVAELAGVTHATVYRALRLPDQRDGMRPTTIRKSSADKIMAVKPVPNPKMTPATGTIRRLQALSAIGWPIRITGAMADIKDAYRLTSPRRSPEMVERATAKRVAELYATMRANPAPDNRSTRMARAYAKMKGWPPPWAWDNRTIDDPNAGPLPYDLRTAA